ncbi:MAG TPA: phosphoribosylformylglycinamidine synthase subunit PurL [Bryobacteraceae bacterium]|nr:phosphoribosylformylglycinamidine synthase subunit PurL [Bryobacterales bacterium]HRJ19370.1 phosphoribosylformylglycinamidine synthase subunit PurL [Bryobacteraceae bacterium]
MSEITPEVIAAHQLTPDEYDRIVAILGRTPNLTELGIFSVMWSEHCSYKSSRLHLKKLPTRSPRVVQGPGENAGILDIGQDAEGNDWCIAFKIESHNHPSFIEPFQGAATGVGGILRDIFTMGARPIAVMDALRFGPLDHPTSGARNRRILDGVVSGIAHYGNCFGVPTVGGETVFEPSYNGNPLVNVFALGVFRKDQIFYGKASGEGNPVIYVGAKTGRDGIHGASMASAEFTEESKQKRPNVQMGDPFMEKLLLEACLEAMATGAIAGIQDMGAAGLTCSTCEMGSRAGTGIEFDLAHVPQREKGMTPYEIMLSESQERMLLVAFKGRENEVLDVFKKWGLDANIIGQVTTDGILRVKNHGEVVAEIPNRPLADEAPLYDRPHTQPLRIAPLEAPAFASADLTADLFTLAASGDLCDKRWIWEQYDYMVRTNTLAGPGGDAAIVRIKETGTSVAMALDGNGRYTLLDPREGVKLMVAECCRNLSCVGAEPVGATNNLNFGNPERPEIMAQLVEAIEGMAEACAFFETPITGGNVSLYNETLGDPIFPSPVLGIVGLLPTGEPAGIGFREEGHAVYLLGGLGDADDRRMGGTQYAKQVLKDLWGLPPRLDMAFEKQVQTAVREIARSGIAQSIHDVSDGGLAWALAECAFPNGIGVVAELDSDLRPELLLFHEGPSRVVVSTADPAALEALAARHGVPALRLGLTVANRLSLANHGATLIDTPVDALKERWSTALASQLEAELHV